MLPGRGSLAPPQPSEKSHLEFRAMYLEETELPLYDAPREAWIGWASLTSVLLALAAALMAFAAAYWGVHAYLGSQKQQRHWADYQALISKVESLHYSRDFFTLNQLLEPKSTKVQELIEDKLQECEKEAAGLNEGWSSSRPKQTSSRPWGTSPSAGPPVPPGPAASFFWPPSSPPWGEWAKRNSCG